MDYCRKKLVNNLKSSIFCGTKGFLTFSLAFLSYLEYSLRHNTKLQEGAAFAMKRNTIPFLETTLITILSLVKLRFTYARTSSLVMLIIVSRVPYSLFE